MICDDPASAHTEEGIRIKPVTIGMPFFWYRFLVFTYNTLFLDLEEDGVRIALTIVDTPGFGDNINNEFAYVFLRTSSYYTSLINFRQLPGNCRIP